MTLDRRNPKERLKHIKKGKRGSPIRLHYVIQQHKSKSMHWDFRLQIGNKMYSWAIPKGPSLNPRDARLAVETTPHDIGYNTFEGVIDKGLYGAGKVLQWDKGLYQPEGDHGNVHAMFEDGLIKFELHGKKLHGKWALVKTHREWLLIKMNDQYANKKMDVVKSEKWSTKSGKTINQINKHDGFITEEEKLGFD